MKQATGMLLLLECAAVGSGILAFALLGNALLIGAAIFGVLSAGLFQRCERLYRKQQRQQRALRRKTTCVSRRPALQVRKGGGFTAA